MSLSNQTAFCLSMQQIHVTDLTKRKNLHGELFRLRAKLLIMQIPNWNDWISSEKFCWPTVNVFGYVKLCILFTVIGLWSYLLAKSKNIYIYKYIYIILVWSYPLTHVHALPAVSAGVQENFPRPCWCSCTPASSLVFLWIRIGRKNAWKHEQIYIC